MSAFGITPASTSIPLDDARHGVASFTVTNQLGRTVRAVASVTPTGARAPEPTWFSGPQRPERELGVDAADQFAVEVTVPRGVPGGTYAFRLDVVSVELPEEEFAHGPEVTFQVPEPPIETPPPPPKPPPGYVETVAGAIAGAIVGGLGTGLIGGLAILLAAGLTRPDDLSEAIGDIILFVLFVVLAIFIGIWAGAAVGINLLLKLRGFEKPLQTAAPFAVLLPIWAIVVLVVAGRFIPDGIVGVVVSLLVAIVILAVPALVARVIFRFRTTGGL